MDKLAQYRKYVQTLLSQYAKDDVSDEVIEVQLIFDSSIGFIAVLSISISKMEKFGSSKI
jgi:XisI protein